MEKEILKVALLGHVYFLHFNCLTCHAKEAVIFIHLYKLHIKASSLSCNQLLKSKLTHMHKYSSTPVSTGVQFWNLLWIPDSVEK